MVFTLNWWPYLAAAGLRAHLKLGLPQGPDSLASFDSGGAH